jgi:hypothetical protein
MTKINIDRPARTVNDVNKILARQGHPERLVKGEGYLYWIEGTSCEWPCASIYTYRLSDLTIRQYLEDHQARVCQHLEAERKASKPFWQVHWEATDIPNIARD